MFKLSPFILLLKSCINRKKCLEIYHQPSTQCEAVALLLSNTRTHGASTSRYQGGFITHDQGRVRKNYHNSYNNRTGNRGFYHVRGGRSNRLSQFANNTCQICNKVGHSALTCRERHNYAQQPDDLPAAFSVMSFSLPSGSTYFPDSGAINHMTLIWSIHNVYGFRSSCGCK